VPLPAVDKLPAPQIPLPPDELQPTRQYAPAREAKHALNTVDPLFLLYVPAGHAVHDALEPLSEVEWLPGPPVPLPLDKLQPARQYAPAGQALHAAVVPLPAVEKLPELHNPFPLDELQPARQYAPAGQAKHALNAVDPLFSLYVPAEHAAHDELVPLPAVEKLPAPHNPLPLDDEQPTKQYAPAGHGVQEDALTPAVAYNPGRHEPEVAVNPVPAQNFPGSQGVQVLESVALL
jgi:hypothetical protein